MKKVHLRHVEAWRVERRLFSIRYFVLGTLLVYIAGCAGPAVTTNASKTYTTEGIPDVLTLGPSGLPDNSPPYIDHLAGIPFASHPHLNRPPFFHHKEVFIEGDYLYAAVDPNRYPNKVGDTYSIYVVEHKTLSQWEADPSLVDVTGAVETRILEPDILFENYTMVWPNMSLPSWPDTIVWRGKSFFSMLHIFHKSYDIVFDFNNNAKYDKEDDILDNIGVLERSDAEETGGFTLLKDPASAGDFPVSTYDYNIGLDLIGRLYYPAASAGTNQPVNIDLSSYPLIIIAHGQPEDLGEDPRIDSYLGYEYLGRHLASRGFICASIALHQLWNGVHRRDRERAEKILEHVTALLPSDTLVLLDPNFGISVLRTIRRRIDPNRVGLLGHSLGGLGVVLAQEIFSGKDPKPNYAIKAVATFSPSFSAEEGGPWDQTPTLPYLTIYGTYDGSFRRGYGLRFFERASRPRHMITIYGANHNYFNEKWDDEVHELNSQNPRKIKRNQQESLTKTFITAFFFNYLHDQQAYGELFSGHAVPPSVSAVPTTILYSDQPKRLNAILTIDDFEKLPPRKNSLGKENWSAQTSDYAEELLPPCTTMLCQNHGLRVAWESRNAFIAFDIGDEVGGRNVLFYDFLNFRVAQYYREEDNYNKPGGFQDLAVYISDDLGRTSPPVRVRLFAYIPFTDIPDPEDQDSFPPKSIMQTVRIPLRAFTANGFHLDLQRANLIVFSFEKQHSGELIFDDIEFLGVDMSEPDPAPGVIY